MKTVILKDSDLSPGDKKKIRQFVVHCFGKDNSEDRKTLYFSPTFRHLLLYEDKKLISYLRIIKRKTEFKDKEIIIGGIGDVSTLPDYRNKGCATKLLKKAMRIMKTERADIGLLQTNPKRGVRLYGEIGFKVTDKQYTFNDVDGKLRLAEKGCVMMAPINSPHILDEILSSKETLHIGDGDW